MTERVQLTVTMELLSDAIFGSGNSIPGGEDIAVMRDDNGYPYIPGTAVKGLLRESMEDLLVWTGGSSSELTEIFGEAGWNGVTDDRRAVFTPLTLANKRRPAEEYFGARTFTALENGVVRTGTLRTAACVVRGLTFSGSLICARQDVPLIRSALAGVKWAGAQRSRGFGRVKCAAAEAKTTGAVRVSGTARCIRYRLRADTPVLITDRGRSADNSYETQGYISGSAVRGAVMSRLAAQNPALFAANKIALLSDRTRFLDAAPAVGGLPALPSIKGFYEDKEEKAFESLVKTGSFTPGLKRARLGAFCALQDGAVHYWSARTGGVTRIKRGEKEEDTRPFQTRYLSAGQEFEGYILLEDPALADPIAEALSDTVWLGADRYEGYGKCSVTVLEAVEAPAWQEKYGYTAQDVPGQELYLLAVSPFVMLDGTGEPRGLDLIALAEKLGVGSVTLLQSSTAVARFDAYNRTWQCREPALPMYDRGSIFKLRCDRPPQTDRLLALQGDGLGVRRAQGFGQILFLRSELFEGLNRKQAADQVQETGTGSEAEVRRARYRWIMNNTGQVRCDGLSRSQLGSLQALCEKAIAGGKTDELTEFLRKNETDRGAEHGSRFRHIGKLVRQVLGQPVSETVGAACPDSMEDRLRLLCQLFDLSRKEGAGR